MFYSHTFLARKGPLGTVWCAAHLQHKLKKSHYVSTDIFSTVERIMHPEVPIALRMSGHLLLGIVRIYSKQVDYLYQDYNEALVFFRKACSTLKAKEHEGDTDEPSVTVNLPKNFILDKQPVDDNSHRSDDDDHVKRVDEITLPDHDPFPYVIENVDTTVEVVREDPASVPKDVSESLPVAMEEDSPTGIIGDLSAEQNNPPEPEIMRDVVHDTRPIYKSIVEDMSNDRIEPDGSLEEQIIKDRETIELPNSGDTPISNAPPEMHVSEESSKHSLHEHGSPRLEIESTPRSPLVRNSPELAVRDSPLVAQQGVRARKRRRQFYDEVTILTNRVMKDSLDDTSNLLRKKRIRRVDNLGVWKQQNRLKKEAVFSEPVITGLSADLCIIYNPQLKCPASAVNDDMEIEYPRNEDPTIDYQMSPILPSLPQSRSPSNKTIPSPSRREEYTPQSDNRVQTTRTEIASTPEMTEPPSFKYSDTETSTPWLREEGGGQNTPLSDIPEMVNSSGHLDFLDHDDNSPAGTPDFVRVCENEAPQFDMLPATTRAVGQFFKRQSPGTSSSEHSSESVVSLDSILEGKTRKICARMFFETLVLKSYDFVDVKQEEPYSAVKLKVTSRLKEQCSG